jgi:hypothetical protein
LPVNPSINYPITRLPNYPIQSLSLPPSVAIPTATAPPIRAAATAAAASTTTTAAVTATATAAAETAAGFRPGTCFVDREAAAAELILIELGDRFLRLFVGAHLDECKPAGTASGHVAHEFDVVNCSGARKELLKIAFARFVRQISYIEPSTHLLTPLDRVTSLEFQMEIRVDFVS